MRLREGNPDTLGGGGSLHLPALPGEPSLTLPSVHLAPCICRISGRAPAGWVYVPILSATPLRGAQKTQLLWNSEDLGARDSWLCDSSALRLGRSCGHLGSGQPGTWPGHSPLAVPEGAGRTMCPPRPAAPLLMVGRGGPAAVLPQGPALSPGIPPDSPAWRAAMHTAHTGWPWSPNTASQLLRVQEEGPTPSALGASPGVSQWSVSGPADTRSSSPAQHPAAWAFVNSLSVYSSVKLLPSGGSRERSSPKARERLRGDAHSPCWQ